MWLNLLLLWEKWIILISDALETELRINIEILWIAAQTGIIRNDLADQSAKEAAKEAADLNLDDSLPLSFTEIKKEI